MVAAARQKNPKKLIALDLFDWKLDIAKKAGADLGGGDHLLIIFITFVSYARSSFQRDDVGTTEPGPSLAF